MYLVFGYFGFLYLYLNLDFLKSKSKSKIQNFLDSGVWPGSIIFDAFYEKMTKLEKKYNFATFWENSIFWSIFVILKTIWDMGKLKVFFTVFFSPFSLPTVECKIILLENFKSLLFSLNFVDQPVSNI